jgi:hypothetical protein
MTNQPKKTDSTKIVLIVLFILGLLLIGDDAILGPVGFFDDLLGVPLSFGSVAMFIFKYMLNKKTGNAVDSKPTININPSDQKALDKN